MPSSQPNMRGINRLKREPPISFTSFCKGPAGRAWTGVSTQNFCHFSCHLMCSPLFLLARCLQS